MDVLPEEEEPKEKEEPDIDIPPAPLVDLRDLVRGPEPYLGERVSVVGKFRGNNLYGDLSISIKKTPRDFVIKMADVAIWVTGRRPRGKGFELNPRMRRDTGKWLKVTGIPWMDADVVYLKAEKLELAPVPEDPTLEPEDPEEEEENEELAPPNPPEVTFSLPMDGERGIPLDTEFRIQFSHDMDPDCFAGNVELLYSEGASVVPNVVLEYDMRSRSLVVLPSNGLEPGKQVELILYEGLVDEDGVPLLAQLSSRRATLDRRSGRRKLLTLTFITSEG
jgi:hypothetical protein